MTAILAANPLAPDVIGFTVALVVFLVFFALAAKLVWPKIIAGLDERYAKIRHEIDNDSGIGTQFLVADLNRDRRLDIVTSNKHGVRVIFQTR